MKNSVLVIGANGMVGSAIYRLLAKKKKFTSRILLLIIQMQFLRSWKLFLMQLRAKIHHQ